MTWFPPIALHLDNWPAALFTLVPMLLNLGILAYGYRKLTLDAQTRRCWPAGDRAPSRPV